MILAQKIELIEPIARKGSQGDVISQTECGVPSSGKSNFVGAPNTHGFMKWRTIQKDINGLCKIRISEDAVSDTGFTDIEIIGNVQEDGWFT